MDNKKTGVYKTPAFSLLKYIDLFLKLLPESPKTQQTRAEKEHGGWFGNGNGGISCVISVPIHTSVCGI